MSVVDEVKQKVDIVAVVSQYTALTKSGQTFRGLCPFHSEKHPSFFVYPDQQSWHCFGACSTGGDVLSFIIKKEGIPFGDALRLLADKVGVTLSPKAQEESKSKDKLYQINQAAAEFYHNLLLKSPAAEMARQYLSQRGLLPQTIDAFQLGFSPDSWDALKHDLTKLGYNEDELMTAGLIVKSEKQTTYDRFRHKVMFPIADERGRITGFGARVLDDSLPKYINSPQTQVFDKSGILYGINMARDAIRKQDLAIIVEGYMDVIIAHQNGLNNVIAVMGTSVSDKQLNTIKKLTSSMALALDADTAGEEAMLRGVGYENTLGAEVKVISLPQGKDPDDVIRNDITLWQQLVTGALPVIDYTFKMVTAGLDLTTARDKSAVADKLLPIIAAIRDPIRRDHYMTKLAELISISRKSMEAALSRIKSDRKAIEQKPEAMARALRPLMSNQLEENCLALLLQHPELRSCCQSVSPDYFENSQNREIFAACQQCDDVASLKEKLDTVIHEHLDSLLNRSLRDTQMERRWQEYTLRLREQYLRRIETMKKEVLAAEAKSGGAAAELAKLQEQGIDNSVQLGEVFAEKSRARSGAKGGGNEPG